MMKRLFVLVVALALCLTLFAGCSSTPEASDAAASAASSADASTSSVLDVLEEGDADSEASSASTAPEEEEPEESETVTPTRGIWEDDRYINESIGIEMALPVNWAAATDEQIAALMGLSVEALQEGGMEIPEELLEQTTVTDMMIQNATTGSNVIVMFENLGAQAMLLDEAGYIEILTGQLESAGIAAYTFEEPYSESFAGEDYTVLHASTDLGMEQYYYLRKLGNYMVSMIVTVGGEDTIESVMEEIAIA